MPRLWTMLLGKNTSWLASASPWFRHPDVEEDPLTPPTKKCCDISYNVQSSHRFWSSACKITNRNSSGCPTLALIWEMQVDEQISRHFASHPEARDKWQKREHIKQPQDLSGNKQELWNAVKCNSRSEASRPGELRRTVDGNDWRQGETYSMLKHSQSTQSTIKSVTFCDPLRHPGILCRERILCVSCQVRFAKLSDLCKR